MRWTDSDPLSHNKYTHDKKTVKITDMTSNNRPDFETEIAEPFPLRRRFMRRFLPAFIGFIGVFLLVIGYTAKYVTESIYLEEVGQRRAQTISRAVESHAPEAWNRLMGQSGSNSVETAAGKKELMVALTNVCQLDTQKPVLHVLFHLYVLSMLVSHSITVFYNSNTSS